MIQYVIYFSIEGVPFQRNFKIKENAEEEYKMILAKFNKCKKMYDYITLTEFKILAHVSN